MNAALGLTALQYGRGAGIFFLRYFLFEVPSNLALHRIGARRWLARIMISWGIISASMMFVTTPASFYALRFLLGAAEAGFFPGVIYYLTQWYPAARRGRIVAMFMTAVAICSVAGGLISGAIMQSFNGAMGLAGWQWLFLLEGLPSVIIGASVLAILPDGPKTAKWLTVEERDLLVQRIQQDNAHKEGLAGKHSLFGAFKDGRVWALAGVYFALATCFYAVGFWMPTIIQELGIDKKDLLKVGLISMIPWGASIAAMIYWGSHSDRTQERRWHCAAGMLCTMIGLLVLAVAHNSPVVSIIALTLITVGWAGCVVTFWSLPTAFLSGTAAAAGIAWINSVGNLGGYFGPDLIGTIRTAAGGATGAAFFALAALALVGALIILLLPKTQPAKPAAATAGLGTSGVRP